MSSNCVHRYTLWCVAFLAPMAPLMGQTDAALQAHVLPSIFDDSTQTVAEDINDRGQIVGWSTDPAGSSQAVLWNAEGEPSQQACPEGTAECWAVSINNRGASVGDAVPTGGKFDSWFIVKWTADGRVKRAATPSGLRDAYANDISDQGFVVGTADSYYTGTEDVPGVATLWWRNGMPSHKLQPLVGSTGTAEASYALAINDNKRSSRLVVGESALPFEGAFATVWDRSGKATALPPLDGDDGSSARSVNRDGTVAGVSRQDPEDEEDYFGVSTAVIWGEDGLPLALDPLPGCSGSSALDINDAGFVVGYAQSCSRKRNQVAVVWNPEGEIFKLPLEAKFITSRALAINSQGDIVGYAVNRNGKTVAIVWK